MAYSPRTGRSIRTLAQGVALPAILSIALMVLIAGCERAEQATDSAETQAQVDPAGQEQPLGQVKEFDGFTLRASIIRTDFLPDAMAQKYGIAAESDLVLLNVVVLENRPDQQPVPVSARLNVQYESLVGHVEIIDMREAEADGYVSYIGTLDASAQRVFRFAIEAQPAGTELTLNMEFEVQLYALDSG